MNNIITDIAERIKAEHRKHPDIDWEYIAASKIYQSFIDKCDEVLVKEENASRDVIAEDDVVKGLLKYHNKLYGDNTQPLEVVAIKLKTEYVCVVNTDYFHTDEIIMFDEKSKFYWALRLIYNTGFSMDIPKETVKRMIRTGEIVEQKDTLSDTTNKNDNTVSGIIHNCDKEPSVNGETIIDTEVYYTCIKDNKWLKKNNQIGFKEIPELPNMMEVNILNGSRFFLKSCAIKQMIANREIDTPF